MPSIELKYKISFMLLQAFFLIMSIVALYYGAEFALDAAEKIGFYFGLSPLVVGLLIVGFGTSLPEFFVSHLASFRGQPEIAMGNIIGSNIANIFLVLGISSLLAPLFITQEVKEQFVLHLFLCPLLFFVFWRKTLTLLSGGLLGLFFLYFLYFTFKEMKKGRGELRHFDQKDEHTQMNITLMLKLLFGFALLYIGGELLVYAGTNLGNMMGISTYVISAIFVAFGTSFPELMTSLLASYKKKNTDLIVGNIIGSNIFNATFVLSGLAGYRIVFPQTYWIELFFLLGASLYFVVVAYSKKNLHRLSGILFILCYGYMVFYWTR